MSYLTTWGRLLLGLSLAVLVGCKKQSLVEIEPMGDDTYYWYFDQKIPIKMAPYTFMLITSDATTLERVEQWASKHHSVFIVNTTPYEALRVNLRPDLHQRAEFLANLQKVFPTVLASQSIIYQGETIDVLNQIIVQPKANDAQEVIQRFGENLKLLKLTKYNTYLFEVVTTSNPLNVANQIQESGLVVFSVPNFLGGIKTQ